MLEKLGIDQLNPMQVKAHQAIEEKDELVLVAPTGTGKTLAFLLPVIERLDPGLKAVQALILVPARELAIQIEQIARDMGSGFKVNAVYGGRSGYKDKRDLKHPPAILVGTPGRIADHIERDSVFFNRKNIAHASFYGGMDQLDREHALIQFRNGTHRILLSSDLASRGIDIPELDFIIHFEFPFDEASFIHRNGRTARMNSQGAAYLIKPQNRELPHYAREAEIITLFGDSKPVPSDWATIYMLGGRNSKISKGDIAGFFLMEGGLQAEELGVIELKQDSAYIAVHKRQVDKAIKRLDNKKLKKKKVRLRLLE